MPVGKLLQIVSIIIFPLVEINSSRKKSPAAFQFLILVIYMTKDAKQHCWSEPYGEVEERLETKIYFPLLIAHHCQLQDQVFKRFSFRCVQVVHWDQKIWGSSALTLHHLRSVHHLMTLQLLIYSLEKLTWTVHNLRSCGGPISSHGFVGPLKCITEASPTIFWTSADDGWPDPNPDKCQDGLMGWTCPWKATKAGGSSPRSQSVKPDSTFFSACTIVDRQ